MATAAVRISPATQPPQHHAARIAESATEAWHGVHGGADLAIPLSVVAALSLIDPAHRERHDTTVALINSSPDEFADTVRVIWTQFVWSRPDLVNPAYPLLRPWLDDARPQSPETLRAAKHVADAVLRLDLLGLTGTENRHDVDLLGLVLTSLRPKAARHARGQYYTAPSVSDLLSRITGHSDPASPTAEPVPGQGFHDPTCGTGGLIRAAAEALRRSGADPADYAWFGNDVDVLAIAGFAVNAVLWGLGNNVVLGVADCLEDPDWPTKALQMREETLAVARDARFRAAIRRVDRLLAGSGHPAARSSAEQTS